MEAKTKTMGDVARSQIALVDCVNNIKIAENLLRGARRNLDVKNKTGAMDYLDEGLEKISQAVTQLGEVDFS